MPLHSQERGVVADKACVVARLLVGVLSLHILSTCFVTYTLVSGSLLVSSCKTAVIVAGAFCVLQSTVELCSILDMEGFKMQSPLRTKTYFTLGDSTDLEP
jgi:hypothetical protein